MSENLNEIRFRLKSLRIQQGLSLQELAQRTGLSKSTLQRYETGGIRNLPIDKVEALAKALNTTAKYIMGWEDDTTPEKDDIPAGFMPLPKMQRVPVVGRIACGEPITAEQNIESYVDAPADMKIDFALICEGDSMIDAGIKDGDRVFIRRQPTVENGQIAAVRINGEATLKRVHINGGTMVLQPASARLKGKTVLQPDDLCMLFSTDTALYKGKRQKDEYIHAYRFQVLTGLRPGELRGLRVKDIQGGVVYVQRSVNVYGETTQGKNENAVRSFVLSDLARCELALQLQEYPSESGYVFPLPSPTAYRERWQKYCASNGMTKTTPYELRHTFVSVVKTLPVGEVKPLVGHSESMDTFGIYGHALQGEDTETAEKINRLFRKLLTDQPKDAQAPNKTE